MKEQRRVIMKKHIGMILVFIVAVLALAGCKKETEEKIEQEGTAVNAELSKTVTYTETDIIVEGKSYSLVKELNTVTGIESIEKVTDSIIAVTAYLEGGLKFFSFFDIEGGSFMNSVTGSYFYWYEDEMDSLVYFYDGNVCDASKNELLNLEKFGNEVTNMEYNERQDIVNVTIKNSKTGKEIVRPVQNKWRAEEIK